MWGLRRKRKFHLASHAHASSACSARQVTLASLAIARSVDVTGCQKELAFNELTLCVGLVQALRGVGGEVKVLPGSHHGFLC